MNILRIIYSLNPEAGGPIEGVRQITPHLSRLGVTTTIASLDHPSAPWLNDLSFNAVGIGPGLGTYGYCRGLANKISNMAIKHDLVIVHGIWQYHSLATWRALSGTGIPYFVYCHGMLDPWFKRTYPLKHLKKLAYWHLAEFKILHDAKAVLFTTEQEKLLARQSFSHYKANEVVVGYGTSAPPSDSNCKRQIFLQRFPKLRDKRIILFLGRIHPKKGVDLLIEAFAEIASFDSKLHLVIAGPDQIGLQVRLQKLAYHLHISDRILWTGMLTGELKWGAFHAAELFCLPSHQENFGIVVAEALACSLPVVISEPVNISTEVSASGAGIVHKDTIVETTRALMFWLHMSPSDKILMSKNAKMLFDERFDFSSTSKNLLTVLNDTLFA